MTKYKVLTSLSYGDDDTLARVGEIADIPEKIAIQFQTIGAVRPATVEEVSELNTRKREAAQVKVKSKTTKPEAKSKWQQDRTTR